MAENSFSRDKIAMVVISLSGAILGIVCVLAILGAPSDERGEAAKDVLTIVLPVLATWIGTVIAFYFGRQNFEAASAQASRIFSQIPGPGKISTSISSIMRTLAKTIHIKDSNAGNLTIDEINKKFVNKVSRLLILDDNGCPIYVIHQSRVDNFLSEGGSPTDTLDTFIADRKSKKGIEFGDGAGFVTVSKDATIEVAKRDMEAVAGCQDIIVTEKGNANEPVLGWVSNTRLGRTLS